MFNFLNINVFKSISEYYGVHPFFWYFNSAFPLILTGFLPFFFFGCYDLISTCLRTPTRNLFPLLSAFFSMLTYSFLKHKEERFIYPLMPFYSLLAGVGIYYLFLSRYSKTVRALLLVALAINAAGSAYFTRFVGRGAIEVPKFLASELSGSKNARVFFLTWCHTAPLYSILFQEGLELDYIHCEPPLPSLNYTNR